VTCRCDDEWQGDFCEENTDSCLSNPCLNGGICHDGESRYDCDCGDIFGGVNCEYVEPHCGSLMKLSSYPPSRNFWTLCEINIIDHAQPIQDMPCRDLIRDINFFNNSDTILAMGGDYGCFPTKFPNEMSDGACVPGYNQDVALRGCLSCTHMGVCIYVDQPSGN